MIISGEGLMCRFYTVRESLFTFGECGRTVPIID